MTLGYRAIAAMQGQPIALERTDLLDQTAALPAGGNAAGMPLQPRKAEQAGLAA